MMTDGCSQEYLSFINNSGKNKSFENAVNGLCYFHSGVVGFCTHVKPTVPTQGTCLYLHSNISVHVDTQTRVVIRVSIIYYILNIMCSYIIDTQISVVIWVSQMYFILLLMCR